MSLVVEDGPYRGLSRVDVMRRARAMLRAVELPRSELSILITNDARVRELNRSYRQKDTPTDVLAFAQREGEHGDRAGLILGDVVVSVPTARRQAEAAKRSLTDEVTMLIAHGLLHLLGWDHDTPAKDRRMRLETARLCEVASQVSSAASRRIRTAKRSASEPSRR